MIKAFSTVILLFFLIPADLSFAQSENDWASKIYSGYLHQYAPKSRGTFWRAFFGKKSTKQEGDAHDRQCSIEFKSPISFSHQSVYQLPNELTYFIKFKNVGELSQDNSIKEKDVFEKFIIKIYTNDDQEYSIDPYAEGKQVGINDEHHIFDSYLIYLILGPDIDHLEVVSSAGDDKGRYVLDKLEIQNDD